MLSFVLTAAFKQGLTPSLSPRFRYSTGKHKLGHGHGECVRVRVQQVSEMGFETSETSVVL